MIVMLVVMGFALVACGTQIEEEPEPTEAPAEEAMGEEAALITVTYLVEDGESDQLIAHALADAYIEMHPNVTIEIENRPLGGDGDNVVKTRLATGDMTDVFWTNAGSLLQALQPAGYCLTQPSSD